MFKKNGAWLLIAGLAIVAVAAVFIFSDNAASTETSASSESGELDFSEEKWDIGTISMKDGNNVKEVAVTNIGTGAINITSLETSCMCTTVQIIHEDGSKSRVKGMVGHGGTTRMNEEIAPGEKAILEVVFDPNAHGPEATGPIARKVILSTSASSGEEVVLNFSGNVTK